LIIVKSILYEGTIALGMGIDFGKGLEDLSLKAQKKNHEKDFLYDKQVNSDLHKTAWIDMAFHGSSCK